MDVGEPTPLTVAWHVASDDTREWSLYVGDIAVVSVFLDAAMPTPDAVTRLLAQALREGIR